MITTRYYTLPDTIPDHVTITSVYYGSGRPIVKIEGTRRLLDRLEREKVLERRRPIIGDP